MSKHKQHIFEWVAIYIDSDNTEKILYQFDEKNEYYNKNNGLIPFVPIVMNILNKEERLKSFHLIPRGQLLSPKTFPRFTVDLSDGTFQINGQVCNFLPKNIKLTNYRLIYFFSPIKAYGLNDDGTPNLKEVLFEYIRLYKLGLQANDGDGKNHQSIMIWNAEDESITIQDQR